MKSIAEEEMKSIAEEQAIREEKALKELQERQVRIEEENKVALQRLEREAEARARAVIPPIAQKPEPAKPAERQVENKAMPKAQVVKD